MEFIWSKGTFNITMPYKVEMVKDTYGYWGFCETINEKQVATPIPNGMSPEETQDMTKSIVNIILNSAVAVDGGKWQAELCEKAILKT